MQELFNLFDEIGLPYFRQGSLSDDTYPSSFFTYWNISTDNNLTYDNTEHRYVERVMVYFYTNDANLIYSQMDDFIVRAKSKGFVVEGRAYDTSSGKSDYYGRLVPVQIINNL